MIPHKASKLPTEIKNIKIINHTDDEIVWNVTSTGMRIILNSLPICIKFETDVPENLSKIKFLIQEHFNAMRTTSIRKEACKQLRDSIYLSNKIDGENRITYNNMSLLHFFGTWLGPTSNPHSKGHAIMNNLHYELFGFHQYHGEQYSQFNRDQWTHMLNDCGDNCQHKTCLKHAKNKEMQTHSFYKNGYDVFSAYASYLSYFSKTGMNIIIQNNK